MSVDWNKMGKIGSAKIHHYTIGRCGSAFISQILFHIFGFENVWAGHDELGKIAGPVVITYRDFRDVAVSYWRVTKDIKPAALDAGRKMTASEVKGFARNISGMVGTMDRVYQRNPHALLFKYEEFFPDNFGLILNNMQQHFQISLTAEQIEEIKNKFNLAANKKRSDDLVTFKKVGKEYMHGNHVYKGTVGGWKSLIEPRDYHILENQLAPHLKKWGYK